ncbi:MAG: DUF302 domain-containing protein [Candidatus Marinimicrobia bacterium]|jgi:uncharacterized protein (DUF302 family)|nr:DUF302 domain-containing protein [Candidatus Neomarinimicrobiota bacterium]MBT3617531.1 DUF302 domain-containing protein [Candidatus Neomarinimicrobiota bacterium]MBT3829208.1 DUF302 domain-containing protein [Candidatus Neomarinimicrobiota bacterium]MBT3996798.1 DUF302 domain-containing protein [Candidatus Neomarinimicrobiota bacterium]MBT4280332.1 DUF302 domain-containing protein [Candidatus Neomarinimicrobiota bacterium]
MDYGYQRIIDKSFDEVDVAIRETLKEQGFGVLTEIAVDETLKNKLNEDFRRYKILGACHPPTAFHALSEEPEIGLLLPCNVTLWENDDGSVTLSAINAKKMLSVTGRDDLDELANQVNSWLKTAVDAV